MKWRGAALACLFWACGAAANADAELWRTLRSGGHVVLLRHGLTEPGAGDPPGFKLGDCKTERNLNAEGRAQSSRLGEAFRRHEVPIAQVLSSEWCRCRDTAELAFGRYETWPALNNLFGRQENAAAQRSAILERASRFSGAGNLILVSHGVTIVQVAGITPTMGEMVVMKPAGAGKLELVGRMRGGPWPRAGPARSGRGRARG
jgi:broad specificity phosphatase PhoE